MSQIIWLASYPKSGNTWLRLLLRALRDDADTPELMGAINESTIASNREVFERVTGLVSSELLRDEAAQMRPAVYRQLAMASEQTLMMKVHDRFDSPAVGAADFPVEVTQAVVYLTRDPRDVCVSFAHHLGLSVDQTLARMRKESLYLDSGAEPLAEQLPQWLGRWDRHVSSWLDNSSLVKPILVRYESLLSDPLATLTALIPQLGLSATVERIRSAIERCQFDRLAAVERKQGFAERPDPAIPFFRSGNAGGWTKTLTPDQAQTICREFGPMMRRLEYDPDLASESYQ